mgnify:CR=1 FL=1
MSGKTLYDKIWDAHVVQQDEDGTCLLYIDRHLVHEVTSPQAFEGLRMAGRKVRHPEKTLAVVDHNVPTTPDRKTGIKNEESRIQVEALARNADAIEDSDAFYATDVSFHRVLYEISGNPVFTDHCNGPSTSPSTARTSPSGSAVSTRPSRPCTGAPSAFATRCAVGSPDRDRARTTGVTATGRPLS